MNIPYAGGFITIVWIISTVYIYLFHVLSCLIYLQYYYVVYHNKEHGHEPYFEYVAVSVETFTKYTTGEK